MPVMSSRWKLRVAGAATFAVAVVAVLATLLASASSGGGVGASPAPATTEVASTPGTTAGPTTGSKPAGPSTGVAEPPTAAQPAGTPPAQPAAVADGDPGAPLLVATRDGVRIVRTRAGTATMDGGFSLAGGARADAIVNVGSGGDGETVTRVLVQRAATGEVVTVRAVPGSWSPPTPVVGGPPEGMSWDGSRIVMQSTDDAGRYIAVPLDRPDVDPVVVRPEGDTRFDAVSSDGNLLYVRRPVATGRGDDAVGELCVVDLRTGRERPRPVPVESRRGTALAGTPVARITNSVAAYTVYVGGDATFVHGLALGAHPVSVRLDLPPEASAVEARETWSIATVLDGSVAVAVNGALGAAYVVRPDGSVATVELRGTCNAPPALALASTREALVRTVAGIERVDLEALRSTEALPAPAGLVALIGTPRGVLAVGGDWTPLGLMT